MATVDIDNIYGSFEEVVVVVEVVEVAKISS